jgi:hypothetical protein
VAETESKLTLVENVNVVLPTARNSPVIIFGQGVLTEGEGSVQLTSSLK